MACSAAPVTPATVPRQAACTQASTCAPGVGEHDRHAVGDEAARTVPGSVVTRASASPTPTAADGGARVPVRPDTTATAAVHLVAENEVGQVGAKRRGRAAAVHQHVGSGVTDVEAQVQRRVRPGRDAPVPRRHERVHAQGAE